MDESDLNLVRAYALKVEDGITNATFNKFHYAFPDSSITSFKVTESHIKFLSGFQAVRYDCCKNSCICYTEPHEDLTKCPKCHSPRYVNGKAQSQFTYLPIIPRLRAMLGNCTQATMMQYRDNHQHDPTKMTDIFDGSHYQSLLTKFRTVRGQEIPSFFFSDPQDIALGLSTDGFGPFGHCDKTCWPILIFNYNLPPEERFLKHNVLSVGTIPGPTKPDDPDSYLWPLIQELIQLEEGVTAFDVLAQVIFILHAFLLLGFGDIPTVSMLICMKGHNAFSPCRICEIQGVKTPGTRGPLYVPLNRECFPQSHQRTGYDPLNLPLRTHEGFMRQANEVHSAPTKAASGRLAKVYGIKGIPALSALSALSFPISFPYNFMHLIWANLIPNLILLWTGNFKALDDDDEDFVLAPSVWESIGEATIAAGKATPAAFGAKVPNISLSTAHMTCEKYCIWTLHLAPILLRGQFKRTRYYDHFIDLVRLLKLCLEYEITEEEIDEVEKGFQKWVRNYER